MWDYIFDNEYRQRSDINNLQTEASIASSGVDHLNKEVSRLRNTVAQLELTVEALLRVLEVRLGLGKEEVALMIQRIDLSDGVEDGRVGPDPSSEVPACPHCGRPTNPKRSSCIYCNGAVEQRTERPKPAPRKVTCSGCGASVNEQETYFSENGVVCARCFQG
jgi:hypothetical protein